MSMILAPTSGTLEGEELDHRRRWIRGADTAVARTEEVAVIAMSISRIVVAQLTQSFG